MDTGFLHLKMAAGLGSEFADTLPLRERGFVLDATHRPLDVFIDVSVFILRESCTALTEILKIWIYGKHARDQAGAIH